MKRTLTLTTLTTLGILGATALSGLLIPYRVEHSRTATASACA